MTETGKIIYYDLRLEALNKRLPPLIGRTAELRRLNRILRRQQHNNCFIIGSPGIGKTALIYGFASYLTTLAEFKKFALVQLDIEGFYPLSLPQVSITRFQEALASLPKSVLFIDNFGQLVFNKPTILQNMVRILKPCLENPGIEVILVASPSEYQWIGQQEGSMLNYFEALALKNQPKDEQLKILKSFAQASEEILELILNLVERFPILGQLPRAAIKLLDESLGDESSLYQIVADKTGIPLSQLQTSELELLKNLGNELKKHIIGQEQSLKTFTNIIQRAKLNLKNPNRPLGSFLVLGPSGVGKTETAKVLAEQVFGKKENFVRLDMSEFSETHTVASLLGAPPGYIGYDAGGGLTNLVKAEPHSLILLDEIEKAHPKIFDVFLQILDDGRLTSAAGETVDFRQTILIATSNLAVNEIVNSFNANLDIYSQAFLQTTIMPILTRHFRTEFLNRFDAIVIFKPLTSSELMQIALLEIKKIENRVKKFNIKFQIEPTVLKQKIKSLADPKLGARPIKRFVEEVCENLIAKTLLNV